MIRALLHQWGDRFHRWLDYTDDEARRIAVERDMDLARLDPGVDYDLIRNTVTGATTFAGTSLLKPPDIDRVTRALLAVIDQQPGEVGHVSELRRGVTGRHVEVMRGDGGRAR